MASDRAGHLRAQRWDVTGAEASVVHLVRVEGPIVRAWGRAPRAREIVTACGEHPAYIKLVDDLPVSCVPCLVADHLDSLPADVREGEPVGLTGWTGSWL